MHKRVVSVRAHAVMPNMLHISCHFPFDKGMCAGSSVVAADKAAVSSGAAEPASKGGYASHVAAPGASAASGMPAGHGEYVNHEKSSGATAGFGGAQRCADIVLGCYA